MISIVNERLADPEEPHSPSSRPWMPHATTPLPAPDLLALRDPSHRRLVDHRWLFTVPEIPHRHPSDSLSTNFIHSGTHATKDVDGPPAIGRPTRHF